VPCVRPSLGLEARSSREVGRYLQLLAYEFVELRRRAWHRLDADRVQALNDLGVL
jgi:hypothetical protein